MRRQRTLLIPRCPGGFLDNLPVGCQFSRTYDPNPRKYESILIVDYVCCHSACPPIEYDTCERRISEDKGSRRRISIQKYGA